MTSLKFVDCKVTKSDGTLAALPLTFRVSCITSIAGEVKPRAMPKTNVEIDATSAISSISSAKKGLICIYTMPRNAPHSKFFQSFQYLISKGIAS